jgi:hypothetical protein
MNVLVKKEIRLLLPSWSVAMLLALIQGITRPYDFYVASLLFFGLTIMALSTIGRETSLNTFSSLLAQPAERIQIWQIKLSVLAVAFLTVFVVWLVAFGIAFINSNVDAGDRENSYNLFITICLIATATFTGGLWTTLLLRQLAGAFWLTLLVPAVLSGFSAVFLAQAESNSLVIAVLSVVIAVYSVGGFLFARWLFFRAQDVGWSGGNIALPEWKIFTRSENAVSTRMRRPIFALLKKELLLQQASLTGAVGVLVLHLAVIGLRKYHHFAKDSAGEVLTSITWMLWLVLAPVIGSMAVAEERRLGVMEGQLCLPVSRRVQFAIKAVFTLCLGIFLGGAMPMLLEYLAASLGAYNPAFHPESSSVPLFVLQYFVMAAATWLTLLGFYGSTLSRSFLQAVGFGIATFFISCTALTINWQDIFHGYMPAQRLLPLIIAVPTIIATLLCLAYFNFKNFQPGWPLWRRNLLGFAAAFTFVIVSSLALYHRAWEVFEPAEPPHGTAKFALAHPPSIGNDSYETLLVRLPDGRVWFDYLRYDWPNPGAGRLKSLWRDMMDPLPKSAGAQRFLAGSNWLSATVRHVDVETEARGANVVPGTRTTGYLDTVGVKTDGTLWVSAAASDGRWTGDQMSRYGEDTNWQQVMRAHDGVLLLKNDGTLWRWGTNIFDLKRWPTQWPNLRTCPPHQIGTDTDWKELGGAWSNLAQKTDGQVWGVGWNDKSLIDELSRETNLDQTTFRTLSLSGEGERAYVRPAGTLWLSWTDRQKGQNVDSGFVRVGTETNWLAVALSWNQMVALRSDGSLWHWNFSRYQNYIGYEYYKWRIQQPPTRLGDHNDWVALMHPWAGTIALAADGSLWLWSDREQFEPYTLLKLPKQPQRLGNVLDQAN